MAEIKFDQKFLDQKGKEIFDKIDCVIQKSNGEFAKTPDGGYIIQEVDHPKDKLDLKQICMQALLTDKSDDEPGLKVKKFPIYMKFLKANNKIELDAEEISLVKDQIAKVFPTLIMGQAHAMLEGK